MAPQHKRPSVSWCIVFQLITHYRSNSFCWSCSYCIRRGGLEVTESAELLFSKLSLCLLDPHQKSSRTENSPAFPSDRYVTVTSTASLKLRFMTLLKCPYISQKENNFEGTKQKPAGCLESIRFVTSWNHCVGVIDFRWMQNSLQRLLHVALVSLSNCLSRCYFISIAICLFKLVQKCVQKNKTRT